MNPIAGIALVLVVLGILIPGVKAMRSRGRVQPETARKLVHLGMGIVCLTFPWIFQEIWPVWVLAGLAVAVLGSLRCVPILRREIGGVLHDVNRASLGEIYFPLGVAAVFTLSFGDPLRFVIPVALLTFADAAGALVGQRWGRRKFQTLEGQKSVEGSLAVGFTGALCAIGPLLGAQHDWRATLVIGAAIGLFSLMLEAISWRGLDNIFLPLAAYAQITVYLETPLASLLLKLTVLLGFTAVALTWRRGQIVDDSARLGAALALYFFWTVGGWTWLVAPVILLGSYVRLMPKAPSEMPCHNLIAIICVGSAGLLWCVAQAFAPDPRWRWLFTLGIATHQAMIAIVRFSQGRPGWSRGSWWAMGVVQAVGLQGLAFYAVDRGSTVSGAAIAAGALCIATAAALFVVVERSLQEPADLSVRWWKQGFTAVLASFGGLLMVYL
jgi:phytol kinase